MKRAPANSLGQSYNRVLGFHIVFTMINGERYPLADGLYLANLASAFILNDSYANSICTNNIPHCQNSKERCYWYYVHPSTYTGDPACNRTCFKKNDKK